MKLYFKCTFLSDVVLTSKAATEGFHESLDYIPGSKFLGILAKEAYNESEPLGTIDLFHNGKVKFGNAYPVIENEVSFPMPFAWFEDKLKGKEEIYLHHFIDDNLRLKHKKEGLQLKQRRKNYINAEGNEELELTQDFSIKSAYISKKRKSKDSEMFGYHTLKAGSQFIFDVNIDDQLQLSNTLKSKLVGTKKIGRSRSAEYGLVEIEDIPTPKSINYSNKNKNQLIIYAFSDLCFVDQFGFNTTDITPENFGIQANDAKIKWELSQIKTRLHQSYNNKRRTSNADYIVIQKGSVIIIDTEVISDDLPEYVGAFQNEGLGRVFYNPPFLLSETALMMKPNKIEKKSYKNEIGFVEHGDDDDLILKMLNQRLELKQFDKKVEEVVEDFVEKNYKGYKGISSSQWGAIKAIAKSTPNEDNLIDILFHQDEQDIKKSRGFLRRGIAAKNWDKLADKLEEFVKKENPKGSVQELLIKVSSKMQKKIKDGK